MMGSELTFKPLKTRGRRPIFTVISLVSEVKYDSKSEKVKKKK